MKQTTSVLVSLLFLTSQFSILFASDSAAKNPSNSDQPVAEQQENGKEQNDPVSQPDSSDTPKPEKHTRYLIKFAPSAKESQIQSLKDELRDNKFLQNFYNHVQACSVVLPTRDASENYEERKAIKHVTLNKPMQAQGVHLKSVQPENPCGDDSDSGGIIARINEIRNLPKEEDQDSSTNCVADQNDHSGKRNIIRELKPGNDSPKYTLEGAVALINYAVGKSHRLESGTVGIVTSEPVGGNGRSVISSSLKSLSEEGINSFFAAGKPLQDTSFKEEMKRTSTNFDTKEFRTFKKGVKKKNRMRTRLAQDIVGKVMEGIGQTQPLPIIFTTLISPEAGLIMLAMELSGLGFEQLGLALQNASSVSIPFTGTDDPVTEKEKVEESDLISEGITFLMLAKLKGVDVEDRQTWWNPASWFQTTHAHVSDQYTRHAYSMINTVRKIEERRQKEYEDDYEDLPLSQSTRK